MSGPLLRFSVIIAVRNGAATLERALESVFAQTYPYVELIVIDGASTDDSPEILRRNDARITYWESAPDRGICHAWNKALGRAKGDWICFLGADDQFAGPDALAKVAAELASEHSARRVVYGRVRVVAPDGATVGVYGAPWEVSRDSFRAGVMIPHQATFHRQSLFEIRGTFDERYRIAADYELLLRELLSTDPGYLPDIVVDMGAGGISARSSSTSTVTREVHRARHKHGLERVPEWRSPLVIRAVIRGWVLQKFGQRAADALSAAYRLLPRRHEHSERR